MGVFHQTILPNRSVPSGNRQIVQTPLQNKGGGFAQCAFSKINMWRSWLYYLFIDFSKDHDPKNPVENH